MAVIPSKGKPKKEAIEVIVNRVTLVDSAEIEQANRAAVAAIWQGAGCALHVIMYDKIAALDNLLRALGMYQHKVDFTTKARQMLQGSSTRGVLRMRLDTMQSAER